jgi:hypothetical protein
VRVDKLCLESVAQKFELERVSKAELAHAFAAVVADEIVAGRAISYWPQNRMAAIGARLLQ